MTAKTCLTGFLFVCVSIASASTNQLSVRVEVADGSTLMGHTLLSNIQVRTSFADIGLPLDQVASMRFTSTNGAVAVRLRNGDSLSGNTDLKQFTMDTILGKVAIPAPILQTVTVMLPGGGLPPDLFDSLVLHYSFDSDEGDRVTDRSSKENHGKAMGKPSYTPDGKVGGAMVFDGRDDYIDAGMAPSLRLQRDFTLMVWAWFDSHDAPFGIITRSNLDRRSFEMQTSGGASMANYFWDQNSSYFRGSTAPGSLATKRWHHIVLQHDSRLSNHQMLCFIDGAEHKLIFDYESTSSVQAMRDVAEPIRIGAYGSSRYPLKGRLDEVMIFNRVLTADEIKRIYEMQN
jgi:hypothetical protein